MPDRIYVDSIKVSAGPFTVKTGLSGRVVIKRQVKTGTHEWGMPLAELVSLGYAIGEYLHMRSMEG